MPSSTVWITGANGLIGSHLLRAASVCAPDWAVRGVYRQDLDLTDYEAVRRAFHEQNPQLIIHCAALSRSPACQADPALARKLNVEVTAWLAGLASKIP